MALSLPRQAESPDLATFLSARVASLFHRRLRATAAILWLSSRPAKSHGPFAVDHCRVREAQNALVPRAHRVHVRRPVSPGGVPAGPRSEANRALPSFILIGLLISYLPQHYRIISRGTSEGISPYFVLLGTTSATAGFANILTVPPSRAAIGCCKELETFECAAGLLGVAQLGMQWLCFALMYATATVFYLPSLADSVFSLVLFLIFFRYREANVPQEELGGESPKWQTAVAVGLLCVVHGLIVIIVTGVFAIALPNHLTVWANVLGVMAAGLAAIQYVPQIWMTYHLKHVGSLSIPMMCIQTPGGFLFAASLYARLGPEGWSTWAIYLLTAVMQGTVLVLGVYYEIAARRYDGHGAEHGVDGPHSPVDGTAAAPRRPSANRTYSEGWERGLPGPFTGHPERYAETEEDLDHIQEREERAIARENQPLLRPGGIGNPRRNYNSTRN